MPIHRSHLLILLAVLIFLVACDSSATAPPAEANPTAEPAAESMPMDPASMARMHARPPADYAGLSNPLAGDSEAVEAGEALYDANCANCHGPEGWGDGAAGASLDPAAAVLARGMRLANVSDGYLYWRISEGGAMEPFESAMPAWSEQLTETERWQLVTFIRTLSTGRSAPGSARGDHMGNGPMHDEEMGPMQGRRGGGRMTPGDTP